MKLKNKSFSRAGSRKRIACSLSLYLIGRLSCACTPTCTPEDCLINSAFFRKPRSQASLPLPNPSQELTDGNDRTRNSLFPLPLTERTLTYRTSSLRPPPVSVSGLRALGLDQSKSFLPIMVFRVHGKPKRIKLQECRCSISFGTLPLFAC